MDLSKAFDTLSHDIIVKKLEFTEKAQKLSAGLVTN